jgi:hypothetical protein
MTRLVPLDADDRRLLETIAHDYLRGADESDTDPHGLEQIAETIYDIVTRYDEAPEDEA